MLDAINVQKADGITLGRLWQLLHETQISAVKPPNVG
jgi:hypothetical protein